MSQCVSLNVTKCMPRTLKFRAKTSTQIAQMYWSQPLFYVKHLGGVSLSLLMVSYA
jgi:hypothetical protein